jgi:hypothetical protein
MFGAQLNALENGSQLISGELEARQPFQRALFQITLELDLEMFLQAALLTRFVLHS